MKITQFYLLFIALLLAGTAYRESNANRDYACYGQPASCATSRTGH